MGCVASRPKANAVQDEKRDALEAYAAVGSVSACDTSGRLYSLRKHMELEQLDAYVVPSQDAHGSEYTAACDQRRAYISGFTGSAGTAVVLMDSAHLFTDGRYHIQAGKQLDSCWTLHKVGVPGVKDWREWITTAFSEGARVGMDPTLETFHDMCLLQQALAERNVQLHFPEHNLVDYAWRVERPDPVLTPIYEHELKFAGVAASDKLTELRKWLREQAPGSVYVLSALDEIAWLLNVRGASIPCNPVFPAYVAVAEDATVLFVDERLAPKDSAGRRHLEKTGVSLRAYEDVFCWLSQLSLQDGARIYTPENASFALVNAAGADRTTILGPNNVVALAKARKNATELKGLRHAYLRDGAAWVRWAAWLEERMLKGDKISERAAADELERIRAQDPLYAGMQAYDAISATGPNAALPHYETPEKHAPIINRATPYLNDSGPQYHDGTIDTTRTVHFGRPTHEQMRAYTRVLQGHIALATARFPSGTTGAQLDMLARQPLFQDGYNYLHGTGHGIGAFLNVHEGPHGLSSSSGGARVPIALEENMVLSDEPGFYEEGHFGIRIESIVAVTRVETHRGFGGGTWLGFEYLTRVPIDRRMVDEPLLSPAERKWLQEHNDMVRRDVLPLVRDDRRAVRWLRQQ